MIVTTILIACVAYLLIHWFMSRKNLPPGPPILPIIGSLPFLSSYGIAGLLDIKLAQKYGKLVTVGVGPTKFIVINDYEVGKTLLNMDELNGRYATWFNKNVTGYKNQVMGILFNDGPQWHTQRRFSLRTLKNLGLGRKSLESMIHEEVIHLFEIMESQKNEDGDLLINTIFTVPVVNVLWKIVGSQRFDANDPKIDDIIQKLNVFFKTGLHLKHIMTFLLPYLPYNASEISIIETRKMFRNLIDEHEENLDPHSPSDFIDFYLSEIADSKHPYFNKEELASLCLDLFQAGAETTSTTLMWSVLLLSIHPEIQTRCAEEIEKTIRLNYPQEEDIAKLPYCMATIMEIQRFSCTAPGSIPHKTLKDVTYEGYVIPKGSTVVLNIMKLLYDESVFPDPYTFSPERFYKSGQKVKKPAQFIPFGIGKRICLGESLARQQLFIFVIMLIQHYKIGISRHFPKPDPQNHDIGITKMPSPFYVNIQERKTFNRL